MTILENNKLPCHSFMDAGRKTNFPVAEAKDFIIYGQASNMNFLFALVPPYSSQGRAQLDAIHI